MQELTLEQTEQVGGGIAAAFAFLAFWAVAYALEAMGFGTVQTGG